MSAVTKTPSIEDQIATIEAARQQLALASIEPLKAMLAQGESLRISDVTMMVKTLALLVEDGPLKTNMAMLVQVTPDLVNQLTAAVASAEKKALSTL